MLIDATALPEDRGGVGRYVDELVAHLPLFGADVLAVCQPQDRRRYEEMLGPSQVAALPSWAQRPAARFGWEQTGLPAVIHSLRPDVVHSPHYTMPLVRAPRQHRAQVVTLHDATFFSDPDLHIATKARFFAAWTRIACRRADALIVPSEATKDEVIRHVGAKPSRIAVIPHGVDHTRFRPPTEDEVRRVREWLGLADGTAYVAFLGTLEPRKNVPALIRAYAAACGSMPNPPTLVLAGGRGWDAGIDEALADVPVHLTVMRPGFVPDGLVPALLGGADVVAYPSLGEGFGLPVLEAMACGAAVLTTRRLSLPEVGGDAVAYSESPDFREIARLLAELLGNGSLRGDLRRRGHTRAQEFSWARSAAQHVALYERCMSARR